MTIDDLAKSIAKGLRAIGAELRLRRESETETRTAVVEYTRSIEQRDERRMLDQQRLETRVSELERRLAQ